ncbi:hypothetical protein ACXR0O_21205 [Verrucomicrobiota bacterium sgz303538]
MRGNLTDQDLTNYALNELDPHQRLYVESMLAVSVECRNDVYEMLDVAQMLEEGFNQDVTGVATLTSEQRARLTRPRRRRAALAIINKAAASFALAACVAFAIVNPHLWNDNDGARKVAEVSSRVSDAVTQVVAPVTEDVDIASYVNLESFAEDTSDWMQAASDALPQPSEVCTPPSWLDSADLH